MPLRLKTRTHSFNLPACNAYRGFLLLLAISLLSGTLAAQNQQEAQRAAEGLYGEAVQLIDQGTNESLHAAIKKFEEALPLFRSAGDRQRVAWTVNNIGFVYNALGEKRKALDYFTQALPLIRAADLGPTAEAVTLSNLGTIYSDFGETQKALDYLFKALPLLRADKNVGGEAITLNAIGRVYSDLGDQQKAIDYYRQALPLSQAAENRPLEAETLNNIGVAYERSGEFEKALDYYEKSLPIRMELSDLSAEADTLNSIGYVHNELGESQKALAYHQQALSLSQAAHDLAREAGTLNNIGFLFHKSGERQKALEYYTRALEVSRAAGDRLAEATTLDNVGMLYSSSGEVQKGLDSLMQGLEIRRALNELKGEANSLNNIGSIYDGLGEMQKALDFFQQALAIIQTGKDRGAEAMALHNIGSVYMSTGEKQKALDYFEKALPLRRVVHDRAGEATTLNNIGYVYFRYGSPEEKRKALAYFQQALPLFRAVGDRGGESFALTNIGAVYLFDLLDMSKALEFNLQALSLARAMGNRSDEALVLANLSATRFLQGNLPEARARIEEAIAIVESIRTKIGSQQLRASYFATVNDYYGFYIDLLMGQHRQQPSEGHDVEALQVSERARARALLETLAEANADIRQGVDPGLVERERALQRQLNAKAEAQMKLLSNRHSEEQTKTTAQEIEALTTEFQRVESEIRQTSPRYAALTQPQPLTLKEIQTQVLDDDTLLLEYSLGEERSYLWAVTPNSMKSYELPKRDEIERAARRVYDLLNARNKPVKGETKEQWQARIAQADGDIPAAAAALSRMVLAPVAPQLGKKRLVIVADGSLQYIPFAALPAPYSDAAAATSRALIVEHEIVSLPSASTLAVIRREVAGRKPAPKTVVALADPVFVKNDERVKGSPRETKESANTASPPAESVKELELIEATEDIGIANGELKVPRLPGSRKEAQEIVAMVAPGESKLALDFEASRALASSAELSQYRYVHFSTHGFLNSVHPELSGIVFSLVNERGEAQDGFLRAHEVFNLKLPAEVVVLSACKTGIGKEVKGEGLVSLTRGFMYAGAPRVVVSLWSVSEMGTTELMVRFYREMIQKGKRPADALRAAQISLMQEKRWASPFYWAGFALQGEWR
jgi:CHAT domain-containing protein/tetratricopeptide (TPR) repeat protein